MIRRPGLLFKDLIRGYRGVTSFLSRVNDDLKAFRRLYEAEMRPKGAEWKGVSTS